MQYINSIPKVLTSYKEQSLNLNLIILAYRYKPIETTRLQQICKTSKI